MEDKVVKDESRFIRQLVSAISVLIMIFIPTISKVFTNSSNFIGSITETTYYWPWMILIHKVPLDKYMADQWIVSGIPWTFIVFLPFFYALKICYRLFKSDEKMIINSALIALMAVAQIVLLFVMSKSQSIYVQEDIRLYFIPQLILIIIHGYLALTWNAKEFNRKLNDAKLKKNE